MDPKDKRGMTIAFVVFMGIGLWAVLDPTAMDGYQAMGRWENLKQLAADYWGAKMGIAMIVMGALAIVGLHNAEGE